MADKFLLATGELLLENGRKIDLTAREAVVLGSLWKRSKAMPNNPYATAQTMASWIWGPADQWPEHWYVIIHQILSHIRHKARRRTWEIQHKDEYGYRLEGTLEVVEGD